jgi:hypothetical protein
VTISAGEETNMDKDYFAGYQAGIADVVKEAAVVKLKKISQFGGGNMGQIRGMRRRALNVPGRGGGLSRGRLNVKTPPTIL